jgi:hypothetical protein
MDAGDVRQDIEGNIAMGRPEPKDEYEKKCKGKVAYPTHNIAHMHAKKSSQITGADWSGYRCPFCSTEEVPQFHIGHTPLSKRKRIEQKRRNRNRRALKERVAHMEARDDIVNGYDQGARTPRRSVPENGVGGQSEMEPASTGDGGVLLFRRRGLEQRIDIDGASARSELGRLHQAADYKGNAA